MPFFFSQFSARSNGHRALWVETNQQLTRITSLRYMNSTPDAWTLQAREIDSGEVFVQSFPQTAPSPTPFPFDQVGDLNNPLDPALSGLVATFTPSRPIRVRWDVEMNGPIGYEVLGGS